MHTRPAFRKQQPLSRASRIRLQAHAHRQSQKQDPIRIRHILQKIEALLRFEAQAHRTRLTQIETLVRQLPRDGAQQRLRSGIEQARVSTGVDESLVQLIKTEQQYLTHGVPLSEGSSQRPPHEQSTTSGRTQAKPPQTSPSQLPLPVDVLDEKETEPVKTFTEKVADFTQVDIQCDLNFKKQ